MVRGPAGIAFRGSRFRFFREIGVHPLVSRNPDSVSGASLWNHLREKQGTRGVNANNLGVVQASHSLGVAGNFQPISFTAITASVRLVTFSALKIAVT
jgi:hypothetical protein